MEDARTARHAQRLDRWAFLLVLSIAAGVILPLLGAVGFFDPWETHYGEVARQMVVRDDYLYPFWKDAHFFSKPVLLFWLTAPAYALLGADGPGPMPAGVELLARLPSALLGVLTVAMLFVVARRFWSRRAATLSAVVLATSPMWAFLSRQAITDLPYVALSTIGLLAMMPTFFDDDVARTRAEPIPRWLAGLAFVCVAPQVWEIARSGAFLNDLPSERLLRVLLGGGGVAVVAGLTVLLRRRGQDPWLHLAALTLGLSVLAKGPVGLGIVGVVVVLSLLVLRGLEGLLSLLLHPALLSAAALFLAVAAPWPTVMLLYDGLDDQRKTWFQRFVLYDLLGRVGAGVHGDRGGLEYYVRYLAFGMLPVVGLLPFAVADAVARLRQSLGMGLGLGQRMESGGFLTPTRAREDRLLGVVVVWAGFVFVFFAATATKFHHYILPLLPPMALLVGAWVHQLLDEDSPQRVRGLLLVFSAAAALTVVTTRELSQGPWEWIDLFTYHYKSYKPEYYFPVDSLDSMTIPGGRPLSLWRVWPFVCGLLPLGGALLALVMRRPADVVARATASLWSSQDDDRVAVIISPLSRVVSGFSLGAVVAAVVAVQVFWAGASQHWSQRWLNDTYQKLHQPGEPLIAFQMDWKGETFYTKNHEIQVKKDASDLRRALARPGRTFVVVQTDRLDNLKRAIGNGAESRVKVVDRSNAKWLLVTVD